MTRRTVRAAGLVAAYLLAAVGLAAAPNLVLLTWMLAIPLGAGPYTRFASPDSPVPVRRRIALTLEVMTFAAAVVALGVVTGPATAALLVAVAGLAVGLRRWRRHRPLDWDRLTAWPADAVPPPATMTCLIPDPARCMSADEIDTAWDVEVASPSARLRAMPTEGVCAAWQRSYWRLMDRPPGSRPLAIVRMRAELLDELERRDPDGFARWLETRPRPVSNPGPFLAADS
jgi:hypothetical protein